MSNDIPNQQKQQTSHVDPTTTDTETDTETENNLEIMAERGDFAAQEAIDGGGSISNLISNVLRQNQPKIMARALENTEDLTNSILSVTYDDYDDGVIIIDYVDNGETTVNGKM